MEQPNRGHVSLANKYRCTSETHTYDTAGLPLPGTAVQTVVLLSPVYSAAIYIHLVHGMGKIQKTILLYAIKCRDCCGVHPLVHYYNIYSVLCILLHAHTAVCT